MHYFMMYKLKSVTQFVYNDLKQRAVSYIYQLFLVSILKVCGCWIHRLEYRTF